MWSTEEWKAVEEKFKITYPPPTKKCSCRFGGYDIVICDYCEWKSKLNRYISNEWHGERLRRKGLLEDFLKSLSKDHIEALNRAGLVYQGSDCGDLLKDLKTRLEALLEIK